MDWNPERYLRFRGARIQAVLDLISRLAPSVDAARLRRIVDLGCGPGNSSDVLAGQWPAAEVIGIDISATMLEAARRAYPERRFLAADLTAWADHDHQLWDLVFSNSALQWIPDHVALLPKLMQRVSPGGWLAFQVPGSVTAPVCQIPRELAARPEWRQYFPEGTIQEWNAAPLSA
ncbi:MAG: methyltransferase domain-containing protein, partial [Terriglobales bacterium]